MPDLALRIASAATLSMFPVLMVQGARLRRRIPRIPEAAGPREGWMPGSAPPLNLLVLGESTAAGVGRPLTTRASPAGSRSSLDSEPAEA